MTPAFVMNPESLVRSLTFVGIVGLFAIYASDVESVTDQSDCTLVSPVATVSVATPVSPIVALVPLSTTPVTVPVPFKPAISSVPIYIFLAIFNISNLS